MMINPSNIVFFMSLISGTMISITSSSWLGMWMGLEMNLISFIPMLYKNKSPYETESMMKYFLVQVMASIIFLISILMNEMVEFMMNYHSPYLICMALMMKMGAAPFHFWFPGVMEGIDWLNCFMLMTWQKIAPFILISYKLLNNLMILSIITSTVIGSVGGLNQNSIKKIMAYSSISHIGWMMSAMMMSNNLWLMYFIIYSTLNMSMIYLFNSTSINNLSQSYFIKNSPEIKFLMMISMLSLAGLPPLLGFLPKWLVIQNLTLNNSYLMLMIMVMTTLLTLYFYMRLMFSSFLFTNQEFKWNESKLPNEMVTFIMVISIIGIPLTTWVVLY